MSCDPLPCVEQAMPHLNIAFVADSSGFVVAAQPALDSVQVKLQGKVFFTLKKIDQAVLKLPVTFDPSYFWLVFHTSSNQNENLVLVRDSVRFTYRPQPQFISEACGYRNIFEDLKTDSLGGVIFQKVIVSQSLIDTSRKIHVQIFL